MYSLPASLVCIGSVPFQAEDRDQIRRLSEIGDASLVKKGPVGKNRKEDIMVITGGPQDFGSHQGFTSGNHDHPGPQLRGLPEELFDSFQREFFRSLFHPLASVAAFALQVAMIGGTENHDRGDH
jgi:hypothetical protein